MPGSWSSRRTSYGSSYGVKQSMYSLRELEPALEIRAEDLEVGGCARLEPVDVAERAGPRDLGAQLARDASLLLVVAPATRITLASTDSGSDSSSSGRSSSRSAPSSGAVASSCPIRASVRGLLGPGGSAERRHLRLLVPAEQEAGALDVGDLDRGGAAARRSGSGGQPRPRSLPARRSADDRSRSLLTPKTPDRHEIPPARTRPFRTLDRVTGVKAPALTVAAAVVALAVAGPAGAGLAQERALAERYAPVVRLVAGDEELRPRLALRADRRGRALRRADGGAARPVGHDLVEIGPTAKELGPGSTATTSTSPATRSTPAATTCTGSSTSARADADDVRARGDRPGAPGQARAPVLVLLRLQRLEQPARGRLGDDPARLRRADGRGRRCSARPVEVGYSQHEGAERAAWDDTKLERVDGTHPVVHPADGLARELLRRGAVPRQLGRGGRRLRRHARADVDVRPRSRRSRATAAAGAAYPWIAFEGRWGELQPAFFNGPEGPNLKEQWTRADRLGAKSWRSRSYTVPGGRRFRARTRPASSAAQWRTGRAHSCGSSRAPLGSSSCWGGSSSSSLPALPDDLAPVGAAPPRSPARVGPDPRRAGADVRARCRLFVGLGVLFVPISLLVSLLQALMLHTTNVLGVRRDTAAAGCRVRRPRDRDDADAARAGLVQAATARALVEIDAGRRRPARAYRLLAGA